MVWDGQSWQDNVPGELVKAVLEGAREDVNYKGDQLCSLIRFVRNGSEYW